ncbi:MAG: site-specific integrase [Candidatus Falkowbacteria bacterium]|nr:site-specific integrase [Candidatus Falkowbacteria bacterium]
MSIYKSKNKYWVSIYLHNKRYRRVSPDNTSNGARAYEAVLRQKLARGEPIVAKLDKIEVIPNFKDFSEKWFNVYVKTNNKYSEVLNKQSVLRAHLNPFFGDKRLDKISNLDIESYKAKKLQSSQANKSVNNHLIILNKCFRTAQEWGVIDNIPKIKLLKVQPQKFDFLSAEECQLLLDNCDGVLREMVLVGLKTGLRFGELIALEWSDIDFKSNLMTVQKSIARGRLGSPKSNKIRYVPLLDDVSKVLNARSKKRGLVFSKDGKKHLGPVLCLRWLHLACKTAGLRKIGWHTLRHTFASHLAQNGVSIVLIKELLGHADIKTTMRYSHLTSLAIRGAVETLNQKFSHHLVIPLVSESKKISIPSIASA